MIKCKLYKLVHENHVKISDLLVYEEEKNVRLEVRLNEQSATTGKA